MGSVLARLLKYIPQALKWFVSVAPLVYEGVKWTVKTIRELKKKPAEPVKTTNPADKEKPDPG